MRRQWSVRRTRQPEPGGQRRWDRAYQEVLAWTEAAVSGEALAAGPANLRRGRFPMRVALYAPVSTQRQAQASGQCVGTMRGSAMR